MQHALMRSRTGRANLRVRIEIEAEIARYLGAPSLQTAQSGSHRLRLACDSTALRRFARTAAFVTLLAVGSDPVAPSPAGRCGSGSCGATLGGRTTGRLTTRGGVDSAPAAGFSPAPGVDNAGFHALKSHLLSKG